MAKSFPRDICLTILDQLIDSSVEKFHMEFMSLRSAVIDEMLAYHVRLCQTIRLLQTNIYKGLLDRATLSCQTLCDLDQ